MAGLLLSIGSLAILVFIITSMVVMGLNVTIRELIVPVKDKRLIFSTIIANFILVPVLAFIIIFIVPLSKEMAAGLILVSIAAGAPSTPKVAELTGGDVGYAVSTTIIMTILTIILMPVLLPHLLEGVVMDPSRIALNLVLLMLLPLLLGMGIRHLSEKWGNRLLPVLFWISNGSIGIIFLTFGILLFAKIGGHFPGTTGMGMVFAAILFTIGSLAIGWFLGGPSNETRGVLAFGTGFRNVTAALVAISATFADPGNEILLMVMVVTLVSVILVSVIVGLILKKRLQEGDTIVPAL